MGLSAICILKKNYFIHIIIPTNLESDGYLLGKYFSFPFCFLKIIFVFKNIFNHVAIRGIFYKYQKFYVIVQN